MNSFDKLIIDAVGIGPNYVLLFYTLVSGCRST